jgi:hypothetical protein
MTYKMSTTRWPSALLSVGVLLAGCAGPSGPIRTETRNVEAFHAIELRGAAEAQITAGSSPSLTITADDASLKNLQTEVKDGVLIIQTSRHNGWFQRRASVTMQIGAPTLDSLVLNGAGDFKLREVSGQKLTLVMAGAGSVSASGHIDVLNARIDGAGSVELAKLVAGNAEVSVNGAGSLSVCATGELNATVNGVGSISYSCSPQKAVTSVHGVGSIQPAHGKTH